MLNIASILKHIKKGVAKGNAQYQVLDDEHIVDTKTSVELHLYNDWIKITYDDETIVTMSDLTQEEQSIVWELKQLITDPAEVERQKTNYQELLRNRRKALSDLFEKPEQIDTGFPIEEEGTEQYKG